jgi:CPA2 family monovalent cation:H+ antiporter-2
MDLLRDLIILFGMAMAIAFLMRKVRQPTVVGYLLTGVVVGPYGLRLISETPAVELMAEVGVALLLFTIGLELSLEKLARMKSVVLGAGSLQVAVTVLASIGALFWRGFTLREGVFWGFLVATSSTAIVMKLLEERGELETVHGRIVLGILLFQDLCVVPMMALVPALAAPGAAQALRILLALAKSLAVVSLIILAARYFFPRILHAIVRARSRELFIIATIFFAMGTAWSASRLGLSLPLGAFLAGIALSESEYCHQIVAGILPFRDSFNSLFFISIGMLINLRFVRTHPAELCLIVVAIVVVKLVTGSLPVWVMGFPLRLAALVGLALAQVGEFSFVLLHEGARLRLVPVMHYQLFLAAAVLTMAAAPGWIAAAPRVALWLGQKGGRRSWLALDDRTEQLEDHVIICGFGLNGRRLARLLAESGLPYVVVEMNGRLVRSARAEGEPIYFGDVGNPEILRRAGVTRARVVIFALSDRAVLSRAISHARLLNPEIQIIARIKRLADAPGLREAGASDVIAEELEAWMEIAVRVLRLYGMPREAVAAKIFKLREEDYEMLREMPLPGQPLRDLQNLLPQFGAELFVVAPGSPLEGLELREVDLRARTGVAVLAVLRDGRMIHNPAGDLRLQAGDQLVLIGSREQLGAAFGVLREPRLRSQPAGTPDPPST